MEKEKKTTKKNNSIQKTETKKVEKKTETVVVDYILKDVAFARKENGDLVPVSKYPNIMVGDKIELK